MKKKSFFSRVGDFLLGKGFYMVLLLCIMAIGGSGDYLYHLADLTLSPISPSPLPLRWRWRPLPV